MLSLMSLTAPSVQTNTFWTPLHGCLFYLLLSDSGVLSGEALLSGSLSILYFSHGHCGKVQGIDTKSEGWGQFPHVLAV